jgi:mannose-6-phosphate isomerase-like protein (cupin superfamily)
MSTIHKFNGTPFSCDWQGATHRDYDKEGVKGASGKVMISTADGAPHFLFRYYHVLPGGNTVLESHAHDHGVMILHGRARVRLGDRDFEVGTNDIIYISPWEVHQFHTIGDVPFGFLCVIPNKDMLAKLSAIAQS